MMHVVLSEPESTPDSHSPTEDIRNEVCGIADRREDRVWLHFVGN